MNEKDRLSESVRRLVRARELSGRGPRWIRAWKRTLFRYNDFLARRKKDSGREGGRADRD